MKQLHFEFEGKQYMLEYTRKSVELMEKQGFVVSDIEAKPMSTLPALFAGAFKAHHPFVRQEIIDKIYAKLPNKQELIGKLAEMYNEPIAALLDEPEEDEGNIDWAVSW